METPGQKKLGSIKPQQISLSRKRKKGSSGDAESAGCSESHRRGHSTRWVIVSRRPERYSRNFRLDGEQLHCLTKLGDKWPKSLTLDQKQRIAF